MLCACLPCSPFITRTDGCAWTSTTSPHSGGVNDGLVDNSPSRWLSSELWLLAELWFCSTDMIPWGYLNYRCESPHWGKHHNLGSRDGCHTFKSCQLEEESTPRSCLVTASPVSHEVCFGCSHVPDESTQPRLRLTQHAAVTFNLLWIFSAVYRLWHFKRIGFSDAD